MEEDIVGRLIEKIHEVFAETYYPDDERVAHNFDLRFENELLLEKLGERDWREVTGKSLSPNGAGLPLLSPAVFRYYLPAFLLNSLNDEGSPEYDEILEMTTISSLLHVIYMEAGEEIIEGFWLKRISPLTRGQRQVIVEFLRFYNEKNPGELFVGVGVDAFERDRRIQRILMFWERFAEESTDRGV